VQFVCSINDEKMNSVDSPNEKAAFEELLLTGMTSNKHAPQQHT